MTTDITITNYPQTYRDECFNIWYAAGHPALSTKFIAKAFPKFMDSVPDVLTVRRWMSQDDWKGRAQGMDNEALAITRKDLIARKVEVLKQQFQDAEKLRKASLEFLLSQDGFDTSAAAVQAFFKSADLERKTIGLSEALSDLANMSEEQLNKRIAELAERASPDDFIDAEEVESDTESK